MATSGRTRLPVLQRGESARLLGMISLSHTPKARRRHMEEEHRREQVLNVDFLIPSAFRRASSALSSERR
jgi:hypothetical protein